VLTFQGLGHAIKGLGGLIAGGVTGNKEARQNGQTSASEQVSGPVGIFVILRDGSSLGFQFMLMIIAIISLTLAIMNILPIPALDGGRLWLTLATRGIGKPISQEKKRSSRQRFCTTDTAHRAHHGRRRQALLLAFSLSGLVTKNVISDSYV